MEKTYKYRIYPNKMQRELIQKTFGCCRFVYNRFLALRKEHYEDTKTGISYNETCSALTILKRKSEFGFLNEVYAAALQQSLRDLDAAYINFFRNNSGYPRFKSKKNNRKSYRMPNTDNGIRFVLDGRHIRLPKLGCVKTKDKRFPQGRILNATVLQEPSGNYYVCLCCTDIVFRPLSKTNEYVGIDLGVKDFAVTNGGDVFYNPRHLKRSLKKLAMLQRELSRKSKGSSNWNRARVKVAKQYEKIANQRKDYLHKLSTRFIRKYDVICIEDLNVSEIIQKNNAVMRRNIADVSWYEFARQLQYKTSWYGKRLIKVDKHFPSSQICNFCGKRNRRIKNLSIREWTCSYCGTFHNRDVNAAKNILKEGLKQLT